MFRSTEKKFSKRKDCSCFSFTDNPAHAMTIVRAAATANCPLMVQELLFVCPQRVPVGDKAVVIALALLYDLFTYFKKDKGTNPVKSFNISKFRHFCFLFVFLSFQLTQF